MLWRFGSFASGWLITICLGACSTVSGVQTTTPMPAWFENARSVAQDNGTRVPELRDVPTAPADLPSITEIEVRAQSVTEKGSLVRAETSDIPEPPLSLEDHASRAQALLDRTVESYENIEGRTHTILNPED
jgi:hypothetical protein